MVDASLSILCTALGGNNNKDHFSAFVLFVIVPPRNICIDLAYINVRMFLLLHIP